MSHWKEKFARTPRILAQKNHKGQGRQPTPVHYCLYDGAHHHPCLLAMIKNVFDTVASCQSNNFVEQRYFEAI